MHKSIRCFAVGMILAAVSLPLAMTAPAQDAKFDSDTISGLGAQQDFDWRWHLQIDGWRRQLAQHGIAKLGAHFQNSRRSEGPQYSLRLCAGEALERQRRSRRLQDHRWRQDLEQNPKGPKSV